MTTSESKGRFFNKTNRLESIRITNRIESNRFESRIGMLYYVVMLMMVGLSPCA